MTQPDPFGASCEPAEMPVAEARLLRVTLSQSRYDNALHAAEVACDEHYAEHGPDGHVAAAIEVFQNHLADHIATRANGWGLDSRTVRYLADEVRSWGARWAT